MSKPQLRVCATRDQLITFTSDNPDDLAIWADIHRFADVPAVTSGRIMVDMWRCEKYASPMLAFADVRAALPNDMHLFIMLNPGKPSTRRAFPWVNPAWSAVCVVSDNQGFVPDEIVLYRHDGGMPFSMYYEISSRVHKEESKRQAAFQRRLAAIKPDGNLYVFLPPGSRIAGTEESVIANIKTDNMMSMARRQIRGKYGWQLVLHYWGDYDEVAKLTAEYERISLCDHHLAPPDRRLDINECTDDKQMPVQSNLPDEIKHSWTPSARIRWLFHHSALVDITLALALLLPPYVLLEIVDWIPQIEWYERRNKIRTIEGVTASIRQLGKTPAWLVAE